MTAKEIRLGFCQFSGRAEPGADLTLSRPMNPGVVNNRSQERGNKCPGERRHFRPGPLPEERGNWRPSRNKSMIPVFAEILGPAVRRTPIREAHTRREVGRQSHCGRKCGTVGDVFRQAGGSHAVQAEKGRAKGGVIRVVVPCERGALRSG